MMKRSKSISSKAGAEIPFLDLKIFLEILSSTRMLYYMLLIGNKSNSLEFDYVLFYPTAIFFKKEDLIRGMRILSNTKE